jgi:hypothetical protein
MDADVQITEQITPVYVSGTYARKLTGYSWGRLQRLGMTGAIGVDLQPGSAPRYRLSDLESRQRQQLAVA